MRLLIVEDNQRLLELLAEFLNRTGYRVDTAASVADFHASVATVQYDLIIVDLGLPDGDGLTAIRALRDEGQSMPILVITARGSMEDRVIGFAAGADDYLMKPFNYAELLARVRALLRRPLDVQGQVLRKGNLELDETQGQARCAGKPVNLRLSERRLLTILMRPCGSVVPKARIEEEFGRELSANAVETLVSRTRKALADAGAGIVIETICGVGYLLREEHGQ